MIETERLYFRRFQLSDLDDFYEYAKNPNVGLNAGWQPHKDKETSRIILDTFIDNNNEWAIVYKENNKTIGSIGINSDAKRSVAGAKAIGYCLSEEYWGKGLMTEAVKRMLDYSFQELNAVMVSIRHFPFNTRSKRVIEKCGFCYEGCLRNAYQMYNGEIYDEVCYSLLRSEYLIKQLQKLL